LGYRVQAAPDGEAALRRLEESNVDVLLCDINMPRIDGMELCDVFTSVQILRK
jgi:CheY-like chemotaxis protein